jgi:CRISPR/Cas system endoribonuclease Cas6 (RAMP superfamily)
MIENSDSDLSARLHNTGYSSLHNSGLAGNFDNKAGGKHSKHILPSQTYHLDVNFLSETAKPAYEHLVNRFIRDESDLELTSGRLELVEANSATITHREMYDAASEIDANRIWFTFHTPVCVVDGEDITTMVPHRSVVYRSLLNRWNATGEYPILNPDDKFKNNLIEKPGKYDLSSCSVLTTTNSSKEAATATDGGGTDDSRRSNQKIMRQGFIGAFGYQFKNATQEVKNEILCLSKFAAVAGIGSGTSRGLGSTTVEFDTNE